MVLEEYVRNWFEDHPSEKYGVMKAYYAYHSKHPNLDKFAHYFSSQLNNDKCMHCGRTRFQVRMG